MLISFSSLFDLNLMKSYLFMIITNINFNLFNYNNFDLTEMFVGMNASCAQSILIHFKRLHKE